MTSKSPQGLVLGICLYTLYQETVKLSSQYPSHFLLYCEYVIKIHLG